MPRGGRRGLCIDRGMGLPTLPSPSPLDSTTIHPRDVGAASVLLSRKFTRFATHLACGRRALREAREE